MAVLLIFFSHESDTGVPAEDGSGLVIGAKVTKLRLPQKITDVMPQEMLGTSAITPATKSIHKLLENNRRQQLFISFSLWAFQARSCSFEAPETND